MTIANIEGMQPDNRRIGAADFGPEYLRRIAGMTMEEARVFVSSWQGEPAQFAQLILRLKAELVAANERIAGLTWDVEEKRAWLECSNKTVRRRTKMIAVALGLSEYSSFPVVLAKAEAAEARVRELETDAQVLLHTEGGAE